MDLLLIILILFLVTHIITDEYAHSLMWFSFQTLVCLGLYKSPLFALGAYIVSPYTPPRTF